MAPTSTARVTLETLGAGVVHAPTDQRHGQPQEDQEDPVLPHLGHNVAPYSGQTIWEKIDYFSSIHLSRYITLAACQRRGNHLCDTRRVIALPLIDQKSRTEQFALFVVVLVVLSCIYI